MPIPGGGRYRVVTTKTGAKVRLHFNKSGDVNEAKNLDTGKVHTPAEFKTDQNRRMNDRIRGKTGRSTKG